jgi:ABC-type sugar transport system ATPase subunit
MVGRPIERLFPVTTERPAVGGTSRDDDAGAVVPTLSVRGLTRTGSFSHVSFSVSAGSIVGVAGLLGAGRTEVLRCIFGVDPADSGEIHLRGRRVRIRSPRHAIRQGINLVPEERKGQGLVLGMSIGDNLTAPHLSRFSRYGWLLGGPARTAAATIKHRLGVKAAKLTEPVGNLSGGNQQKVVIGKAVLGEGDVYLLDEPTRGVDVGAKVEIYAIIAELAQRGSAVVVVSSELPELLGICDRILVMRDGRIVADLPTADSSEEIVLAAAMGHEEAGFRDELA